MREIKFRAWDGARITDENAVIIYCDGSTAVFDRFGDVVNKQLVLLQFTGLHDKNGKEIYEGDILKWDEKKWGCPYLEVCEWNYGLLNMRFNDWKDHCEVVGNIYENPELLETTNGRP